MHDDHRLAEARAMAIADVIARLEIVNLVRAGGEMVGPCPNCGGRDRFGVNPQKNIFQCRKDCSPHAKGDQIALVQLALGVDFRAALDWLCGPAQGLSDAEREDRRRKAEAARERQASIGAREREKTIKAARDIWFASKDAEGSLVRDYLCRRGIPAALLSSIPQTVRFQPDAKYVHPIPGERSKWQTLHVGPAMICAVVDAGNRVTAVHRTWIDLDQAKGKLILSNPAKPEETLPSKKVLGSKKGGAIRLTGQRNATTMIMAEGVETTLSALIAERQPRQAAYWCGVDLGNMSGLRERGPGKKYAGLPDMTDSDAFAPPSWVKRLVFVQDGDSDPRLTRAQLEAGLRRAMIKNPGLKGQIVHAGAGRDLNDILMGQHQ
ncbi:DUF7146 domain-containing protein [Paracoccus aminophilus]|uniref:DNA primase n=1 Tax=Paracoccus aminophilus JCM 7686 TaxID=1367847 RepID=S5YWW1_PARAH|nr:DNA primase [Paracoccus aminophilus]AGT09701.1 DNA primase [Paracoccus aminophilus JCM 7686]